MRSVNRVKNIFCDKYLKELDMSNLKQRTRGAGEMTKGYKKTRTKYLIFVGFDSRSSVLLIYSII